MDPQDVGRTRTLGPGEQGDAEVGAPAIVRIDRFVIERELGRGAMGVVYAAFDPRLERMVAVKILRSLAPARQARLLAEARALAQLSHRHVVGVHDAGHDGECAYLVMELVEGQTLEAWLPGRPWRVIVAAVRDSGAGIAAAHARGIIHGDVKPANILVGNDGVVRVADFGLAAPRDELVAEPGRPHGTPPFLAPERYDGQPASERADQYALAISLYRALYRSDPFTGLDDDEARALTHKRAGLAGPPPGRVPRRVFPVIARALAPRPEDRWPTVHAMVDALDAVIRRRRVAAAVISAVCIVGAALMATRPADDPCRRLDDRLAVVTAPPIRAAITARFVTSEAGYAREALALVTQRLGEVTATFTEVRGQACRADVRERGGLTSRACLDRSLDQLDATLQRLAIAEPADVAAAPGALANLMTGVTRCRIELARAPITAGDRRDQRVLASALAAATAGNSARALELARQALASARRDHRAGSEAAALYRLGATEELIGDGAAAGHLEAAFHLAQQVGDDDLTVTAALGLAELYAYEARRATDAAAWDKVAESLLISLGERDASGRWAKLLANRATAARIAGKYTAALGYARSELALRERLYGAASYDTLAALDALAVVLSLTGDQAGAEAMARRSLAISERYLGSSHPTIAIILLNLAGVQVRRGDLDAARASLERALAIRQAAAGVDDPSLWSILANLAVVDDARGKLGDAIACATRSLALLERKAGADQPEVAGARSLLGALLVRHGELDRAEPLLASALASREATFGPTHASVAWDLMALGELAEQRGDLELARERFERAVQVRRADGGAYYAEAVGALGWVEHALHRPRALARLREAVALSEAALGADHPDLVRPWWRYGAVLVASDRAAGLALLERAVTRGGSAGASPVETARAELALIGALAAGPDRDPARGARIAKLGADAIRRLEDAEQPDRVIVTARRSVAALTAVSPR